MPYPLAIFLGFVVAIALLTTMEQKSISECETTHQVECVTKAIPITWTGV